jgi:hypothetical protein
MISCKLYVFHVQSPLYQVNQRNMDATYGCYITSVTSRVRSIIVHSESFQDTYYKQTIDLAASDAVSFI